MTSDRATRRREPWPIAIGGLLAGMGLVLSTLLWLSIRHADALVVEDAFAAGLRINDEIAARARTEALGWRLDLAATPVAEGVHLRVRLLDDLGRALRAESVVVRRERPAEGGLDAERVLQASGDGFEGVLELPRPGRWRLGVRALHEGETVRAEYSLESPS